MLATWTIENFKSIGSPLTLPLSPITVLVGANSSGKSSIIQSILLIKQTLQYATPDRPIALNGPLLKLGDFNDVKNVVSNAQNFKIGWKYDARSMAQIFPGLIANSDVVFSGVYTRRTHILEVECQTAFDVDPNAATQQLALLEPSLASCKISASLGTMEDSKLSYLTVTRSQGSNAPQQRQLGRYPTSSLGFSQYQINAIDPETKVSALEDHPNGQIIGAMVQHFLPYFIAIKFDQARRRATHIAETITSLRQTLRFQREYATLPAPSSLLTIISEWLKANEGFFSSQHSLFDQVNIGDIKYISDLVEMLQRLRSRSRGRSETTSFPSLQELQPQIIDALVTEFGPSTEIEFERPTAFSDAVYHLREYFITHVRYLGPLRDEPKPLYPLEALGNPTDVGYHGEHTAAVLHLNQWRQIDYIASSNFPTDANVSSIKKGITKASLKVAVVDWLAYMGVVDAVSTDDRGKIGHELRVRAPGLEKFHDLTNVGVGVSQVLPIVLTALLAEPGSLLIFEQPELHLHPRVQTRLADFFISLALAGKQCLLETHSEYLVHRLRRRVAEAPAEELTQLCRLYFVERAEGLTTCKLVDITKYGAILDWPLDFFDQAQVESERILTAASAKRISEKQVRRNVLNET